MVRKKRTPGKTVNEKAPYLTKRILISAAKSGIRKAAKETMLVMGYTIIAKNGWVVKKHADGTIEKVSRIAHGTNHKEISLD